MKAFVAPLVFGCLLLGAFACPPDAKACPPVGVSASGFYASDFAVFDGPRFVDPFFAQDFAVRNDPFILASHRHRARNNNRGRGDVIIFVDQFGRVRRVRL